MPVPGIIYDLFRTGQPVSDKAGLSVPLVSLLETCWTDRPPKNRTNYYTVTFRAGPATNRGIFPGKNSLLNPVTWISQQQAAPVSTNLAVVSNTVPASESLPAGLQGSNRLQVAEAGSEEILLRKKVRKFETELTNTIIPAYYLQKYQAVVKSASKLTADKDCPERIRKEAGLFEGKAYYFMGEYDKAVKIFVDLAKTYPEEAGFWVNLIGSRH
jgi:hypothetical protein